MFHYLREHHVYDKTFSFVLQTRVFFLFFLKYYLKYLSLTSCMTKRNHVLKYHLILFFCNFIIDCFLFGICSTKGAALRKEPHICPTCKEVYIGETRIGDSKLRDRVRIYRQHIQQPELKKLKVEKHLRTCGKGNFTIFPFL